MQHHENPASARAKIVRFHDTVMKQDYFEILGADPDHPDANSIRTTYLKLAKAWHSDAFSGTDIGSAQHQLDAIFKRIQEAYETVSDPHKRTEYKVLLDRQKKGMVTDVNAVLRAEGLCDEAQALIRRRAWDEAETKLKEAISLNKDDTYYPVLLAWASFHAKKRTPQAAQGAIDHLKRTVKRQENSPLAYQYLGQICFQQERYEEAQKWWQVCLRYESNNIDATRGLRLIHSRAEKSKGGLGAMFGKLFKRK